MTRAQQQETAGAVRVLRAARFKAGLPERRCLLIACVPLELASWCALVLHRRFATGDVKTEGESGKAIEGNAWSGMKAVFSSRYLMGIAAFIAVMTAMAMGWM